MCSWIPLALGCVSNRQQPYGVYRNYITVVNLRLVFVTLHHADLPIVSLTVCCTSFMPLRQLTMVRLPPLRVLSGSVAGNPDRADRPTYTWAPLTARTRRRFTDRAVSGPVALLLSSRCFSNSLECLLMIFVSYLDLPVVFILAMNSSSLLDTSVTRHSTLVCKPVVRVASHPIR